MAEGIDNMRLVLSGTAVIEDTLRKSEGRRTAGEKVLRDKLRRTQLRKQPIITGSTRVSARTRIRDEAERRKYGAKKRGGSAKNTKTPAQLQTDILNDIPQPPNPKLAADYKVNLEA